MPFFRVNASWRVDAIATSAIKADTPADALRIAKAAVEHDDVETFDISGAETRNCRRRRRRYAMGGQESGRRRVLARRPDRRPAHRQRRAGTADSARGSACRVS